MPCSRNLFIHPICNNIQVTWTLLVYGLQPEYHYDFCWASQVVPVIKNTPANAGDARDLDLIPGLGRFPGEGNCNPLQYYCLGNPMVLKVVMSIKSSEVLAKRIDFRVRVFIIWWDMSGPGQPFFKENIQAQGNFYWGGLLVCPRGFVLENAGALISEDKNDGPFWLLSLSILWPFSLRNWSVVLVSL